MIGLGHPAEHVATYHLDTVIIRPSFKTKKPLPTFLHEHKEQPFDAEKTFIMRPNDQTTVPTDVSTPKPISSAVHGVCAESTDSWVAGTCGCLKSMRTMLMQT